MQEKLTFITKKNYNGEELLQKWGINTTDNVEELHDFLNNTNEICFDTENSGLDPFKAVPLLESYSDGKKVYVVDRTSIDDLYLKDFENKLFIAANMQYDYKIIKQNYGIELRNCHDVMIAEQIIGRGSGRSNSLDAIHERRLHFPMPDDKSVRDTFIGRSGRELFTPEQILYSGGDVACLKPIVEVQRKLIKKFQLEKRVYEIGFPLVAILGDMHLEGINLNAEKWRERIKEDKRIRFEYECLLDKEVERLSINIPSLRGGKYTRNRQKQDVAVLDIFGNTTTVISNQNIGNISYTSDQQVLDVFRRADLPLPMKLNKSYTLQPSVAGEALEKYLIDYPDSPLKEFCKLLIKHSVYSKAINSFGEIFLNEYYRPEGKGKKVKIGFHNPKTGKVHTQYKQETTANGRLASGDDKENDKKIGVFNSQQMKKEPRYRHCFTLTQEEIDNDWWITTADLSGAELIILAALSGDKKLVELQAKDIHSYLATAAFNKIISYILETFKEKSTINIVTDGNGIVNEYGDRDRVLSRVDQELYDLLEVNKIYKSKTYLNGEPYTAEHCHKLTLLRIAHVKKYGKLKIDKSKWKDIRDPFKNVVYGTSYGAKEDKIASTLNIPLLYAGLVIKAMRKELPISFNYLDKVSRKGVNDGYIIFNTRTNSRHWFKEVLQAKAYNTYLSKSEKGTVERACKNYGISGTQADMIKEAMVDLDKYIRANGIQAKFLLQVHDELVIKHKGKDFGTTIVRIMEEAANKYLNGIVEMKASYDTLHTWTK